MANTALRLLLLLMVLSFGSPSVAERRVALVIGNSNYIDATPLNNALNDANDIAEALERLKFDVVLGTDLDRNQTYDLLKKFNRKLVGADTAVLFYAGHALQVGGENFIAPTDTLLEHEVDLELETISMNLIRRQMERNAKTLLVFLDACRNNPLARRFTRKNRSTSTGRGLAKPEITSEGTFIAFATQPGNVALDGTGRNSPFTTALLNHIEKPGIDISALMIDVRADVYKATNKSQLPWTNSGLLGRFYFNETAPEITTAPIEKDTEEKKLLEKFTVENTAWEKVKSSEDVQLLTKFLNEFPDGSYSAVARFQLEQLRISDKQNAPLTNSSEEKPVETALASPVEEKQVKELEKPDAPISRQLIREVQRELGRVGCDAGVADGRWGRKGRAALKKYSITKNIETVSLEPSLELLENLKLQDGRVCPLVCSSGFKIDGNKCVLKACASGQKRNSRGQCFTPKAKTKTVQKRRRSTNTRSKARKSTRGRNCFRFDGRTICE